MKTKQEIKTELARLKSDERMTYKSATIVENAPLALQQLATEAKIHTLQWILGLKFSRFPLPKKKKPHAKK